MRLTPKLILAFLAVSLTGVFLVALLAGYGTVNFFNDFLFRQYQGDLVERFGQYYQARGSWDGVQASFLQATRRGPGGAGAPGQAFRRPLVLFNSQGQALLPGLGYQPGEFLKPGDMGNVVPVQVDDQEVGYLIVGRTGFDINPVEALFLQRINRTLVLGALGASAAALLLGVVLARTLTRPLRELTVATQAVARGDLDQQVPVRSQDELGQLAESFNQMNAELARARHLRRQMTADIAHDLRTPISVISGYAAGLNDGVLEPGPETFAVILDEAQRLERMVEDLRLLTLSDTGELPFNPRLVAPAELVERAAASHKPAAQRNGIELQWNITPDLPDVYVDPDRMAQVMGHLLDNALEHTPGGGRVTVTAVRSQDGVGLRVSDSGAGIPEVELPHVFDRFYRGDVARQRHEGGSGLGLAITRSLVEAMGGQISVESELGRGTTFRIWLPIPRPPAGT